MFSSYKLQAWGYCCLDSLLTSVGALGGMVPRTHAGYLTKAKREPSTQLYWEMQSVNSCRLLQTPRSS